MSDLYVRITPKDSLCISIAPEGKIDASTCMDFKKQIQPVLDEKSPKVLFDMAKCDYVSSAGIRVFFDFSKSLKDQGGVMSLCNFQPQIRKVFEIVRALPLESVFASTDEADAYLDRMMAEEIKKQSEEE